MNSKVDDYFASLTQWKKELELLRGILQQLPLEEDLKWGIPAYIFNGKNILGISGFKNYFGIWFHHGVFLKDEANILINAQKDKTKGLRQMRFHSFDEINIELLKSYVLEAVENSKAGKEIKPKRNTKPLEIPDELKLQFSKNDELKKRFNELSISKKREFCEYILSAKRAETKQTRIEKIAPMILKGVGLNDKYKNG